MTRKVFLKKLSFGGILSLLPISLLGYNNTNNSDEYIIRNNKEIIIVTKQYNYTVKYQNNNKYLIITTNIKANDKLYSLVCHYDDNHSGFYYEYKRRFYLKENLNITELKNYNYSFNSKTGIATFRLEIAD